MKFYLNIILVFLQKVFAKLKLDCLKQFLETDSLKRLKTI